MHWSVCSSARVHTNWTRLELLDSSEKDMDHQSSVLLCLGIVFFSFSQILRLTAKKPVLNRQKHNRFVAARKLLEFFNEQCLKCLMACGYLYTDEILYRMRNQISFKQFNPNKPAKYGLLFKSINAARYPYTFVTAPYTRKPQNKGAQFYHSGTENVTKYLIERMNVKQKLEGRNISFDRLYT